jgi:hypothetical protein
VVIGGSSVLGVAGSLVDCAQAGPRIKRWRSDKVGNRIWVRILYDGG